MKLPSQLTPDRVIAVVDTREQHPLESSPLRTVREARTATWTMNQNILAKN